MNELKFEKPFTDDREYRFLTLPNELTVLLISDVNTNLSSASLSVNIGYLSDGSIYGMAHYLEHMLFMGNEKYRVENEYQKLVSEAGGMTNAYTSLDHTNYYFVVEPSKFNDVLDIFGHFFIDPLLNKNALEREMEAVNAEHQKNLINDNWRMMELKKKLAPTDSPLQNFSTGTIETLKPVLKNNLVKTFYDKYYSANIMTLVVLSNHSLKDLEKMVVKIFSDIPNKKINHTYYFDKLFENNKISVIEMVPIINEDNLILMWDVPYENNNITSYISYLIEYEGENTLISILKSKNLIYSAYIEDIMCIGDRAVFEINIELTVNGRDNIKLILKYLNEYIELIKKDGIKEQYYEDIKAIIMQNYLFTDKATPENYTSALSAKIQLNKKKIKLEHMLSHTIKFRDFSYMKIEIYKYLEMLSLNKVKMLFSSQKIKNKTNYIEKWYETEYNIYNNVEIILKKNIDINMMLPKFNSYLPDIKLLEKCNNNNDDLFIKNNLIFKYNNKLPKTFVTYIIRSEWIDENKKNYVITSLFLSILNKVNKSDVYEYTMAGYRTNISTNINKLSLSIYGVVQKIDIVIDKMIDNMFNINKITENEFNLVKDKKLKKLKNGIFDPPYLQTSQHLLKKIFNKYVYYDEHINILEEITYRDVLVCMTNIFSNKLNIKCFVFGCDTLKNAKIYSKKFNFDELKSKIKYFPNTNVSNSNFNFNYIDNNSFKNNNNIVIKKNIKNSKETNSGTAFIIDFGHIRCGVTDDWCKKIVLIQLLNSIISSHFFNQLRTIEQLGYIAKTYVQSVGYQENPLYMHYYIVQSPKKSSSFVSKRIKKFIDTIGKILNDMADEEFTQFIQSEINIYKSKFNCVSDEIEYLVYIINEDCPIYNIKEMKIIELKKITKSDIIKFYNKYYIDECVNHLVMLDSK